MVSNDVLGIRGRWCMVWFDVDIQIHRGTGIGWITTKGCRAAEVFQGEPGHEPVLRDHLMHQVLVDQWTWTRHQQTNCFTQVLLAQVQPPSPRCQLGRTLGRASDVFFY